MSTRFGRFVLSKEFASLFSILMPLFTLIVGWQLEQAIAFFFGRSHLCGIPCLLFLLLSIFCATYVKPRKRRTRKVSYAIHYYAIFLIYDLILNLPWCLLSFIFQLQEIHKAVITVGLTCTSIILVAVGRSNTKKVISTKYELTIKGCKKEWCIALISDLHLGMFVRSDHVKKVVQVVNAMNPDLVIIAGDILDVDCSILEEPESLMEIANQLKCLCPKIGTYFVLGNHDPSIENKTFRNFIKDSNLHLLHNESVDLSDIILAGRSNETNNKRKHISEILYPINNYSPVILVDHDPQGIPEATKDEIPLVLCGHTHKGQFFPMDLFTKWANGKQYFYGHQIYGSTQAIISSGAGYFNLPVRIGSNNEVVEIRITGKEECI